MYVSFSSINGNLFSITIRAALARYAVESPEAAIPKGEL